MPFTIDSVYKAGVPRGQFIRGAVTKWDSSTSPPVTVSPETSPTNWAVLLDSLRFLESSLTVSGTGSGIFQMEYPDYVGVNTGTFVVPSVAYLKHYADQVIEHNSATYYVFKFQPPLLVRASSTVSSATFSLPTDKTIDSGYIEFMHTGWTIKEVDYE